MIEIEIILIQGPWGELSDPTILEAGAVIKRGLSDTEMMEGEVCRLSIEIGGVARNACWYLNGAKMSNDFVTIEGSVSDLDWTFL